MSKRSSALLAGLAALALAVTAAIDAGTIAAPPGNRTISLRNIHTDETITVEYKRGQTYVPEALERINWILRDWRRNEPTKMDPALVDLLWEMHNELGSKVPINIISGFRSRNTNEMLRRTVGGQASESRHILGKAADVQFPDVPIRQLRYSAMIRERGGVGYYPTSATPFVHVDTDRVRAWPRMPRYELAVLFPSGQSRHLPASGGPLTAADVREARSRYPELVQQVAAFHTLRTSPRPVLVAAAPVPEKPMPPQPAITSAGKKKPDAAPVLAALAPAPAPKLVIEPRVVDRPSRLTPRPTEEERHKLTELAAIAALPQLIEPPRLAERPSRLAPHDAPSALAPVSGGAPGLELPSQRDSLFPAPLLASIGETISGFLGAMGWSTAPEFDEDHPEEVSCRPFPIAPFLTETPSPDDPALVVLVHPDLSRTLELLDSDGAAPPMTLRPGTQVAQLLWAQRFDEHAQTRNEPLSAGAGVSSRPVRTAREQ